ncbi:peroxin 26 [Cadophora sp. MPI-SDFR-AT-0126]|nr:peroxin 26 [Leotiomycetes sp. MPI-SDFR-AT-0126]
MTSNGSIATTLAPTRETLSSSQLLTSSISSLNSTSSRQATSQISKIYRQSSTLFLTRRLPESLSTIIPVITPPPTDDTNADPEPSPISKAGKTTRVKVWSLYLTILNAVVELDPDEGKQAFGSSEWRGLVTKVRDGEVWEEVVKNGYGGVEGDVDSDVVINLATLLLAHARSQKTNQQRLENYLASSTTPNLDISSRLQTPTSPRRGASPSKPTSGTDTPRDLNARVKILELYTLHVLLRNNEWDYAREFITISSVLDEERREAFLQALQSLQDEQNETERREKEERRYQEEQLKKDIEDAKRRRLENEERERRREDEERLKREKPRPRSVAGGSEVDYGVEDTPPRPGSSKSRSSARGGSGSAKGSSKKNYDRSHPSSSPTARSSAASNARKVPPTILTRASNVLGNVKKLLEGMAVHFQTRPLFILQFLAFLVGFLVVLSRRDVKERLRRLLGGSWDKVKRTAGMGVKVSYI